jgi:hypothetical protein
MRAVDGLERAEKLDGLVGLGQRLSRLLRPGRSRDALHGVWLGHPLHPLLAQAPIGLWLSATVLDAWPGGEQASRRLAVQFGQDRHRVRMTFGKPGQRQVLRGQVRK